MQHIIDRFKQEPGYEVQTDQWNGHENHDEAQSRKLLEWADVIVTNWLLGNAVWYSHHKQPGQLLITCYHRFEIDTPFPHKLHLSNIDAVVSSSQIYKSKLEQLIGLPKAKSKFISISVPCSAFQIPKQPGSEYHLGMLGYNRKLKGLHRALEVWEMLAKTDDKYKLFIKGKSPKDIGWIWRDPEEQAYFTDLFERIQQSPYQDRIIFEPFGADVAAWFSKIGYILSVSDFESFHSAAAEGMAAGSLPLIRNWEGAELIYPQEWIFRQPEDMAEAVRTYNANPSLSSQKRGEVQQYCKNRYDTEQIFRQFVGLIIELMGG